MSHLQDVEEVPYPPAPWKCSGQMWTGIFKSDIPRTLPGGFKHFLDPHLFIVSLIRYLDGTLRYDELLFSTLARLGPRPGIHVDDIWVNERASLWGGCRIWGLPKNLAEFGWDGSTVQITDEHGLIAKISVDMRRQACLYCGCQCRGLDVWIKHGPIMSEACGRMWAKQACKF